MARHRAVSQRRPSATAVKGERPRGNTERTGVKSENVDICVFPDLFSLPPGISPVVAQVSQYLLVSVGGVTVAND